MINKKNFYLLVSGSIATGKTTLINLLNKVYECKIIYEPFDTNPYMEKAYSNMRRWSFHSQLFFFTKHLHQHFNLINDESNIIQERSVYECIEIFAKNFYLQGGLDKKEWELLYELYLICINRIHKFPDLIIFLKTSPEIIIERKKIRNRLFEKNISYNIIVSQNILYEEWIKNNKLKSPIIEFDTGIINFIDKKEDFQYVFDEINKYIE